MKALNDLTSELEDVRAEMVTLDEQIYQLNKRYRVLMDKEDELQSQVDARMCYPSKDEYRYNPYTGEKL